MPGMTGKSTAIRNVRSVLGTNLGGPGRSFPQADPHVTELHKWYNPVRFSALYRGTYRFQKGGSVSDSVAVDAKRILLRYGAPINILDDVSEDDRIKFARMIAKTSLPEREVTLRTLLEEQGYIKLEDA